MPTARKRVSEKTLELNLAAELLSWIRRIPGCDKAFWIGMKQNQERETGIDEVISNVPRSFHLALQMKSPRPTPVGGDPFYFTLSERQHDNLLRLAVQRPSAVHYVLPHANTFAALRDAAPNLLSLTHRLRVSSIGRLGPATNRQGTHKVESYLPKGRLLIYSEPVPAESSLLTEGLGELLADPDMWERNLLSNGEIAEWFQGFTEVAYVNRRSVGQLLRGFGTVCLSEG